MRCISLSVISVFISVLSFGQEVSSSVTCSREAVDRFIANFDSYTQLKEIHILDANEPSVLIDLLNALDGCKKLSRITFANYDIKKLPDEISKLSSVRTMAFTNSSINQQKLYNQLKELSGLDTLSFTNCQLGEISKSIDKLNGLKSFALAGEDENFKAVSLSNFSGITGMTQLVLKDNRIDELPDEFSRLTMLEKLELNNNGLIEFPISIQRLTRLTELKLNEINMIDPAMELVKLGSRRMKYISLTSEITVAELDELKGWFPGAKIDIEVAFEESVVEVDTADFHQNELMDESQEKTAKYGKFHSGDESFKILSDAYLHYAVMFSNPLFRSRFDSLLFDERYENLTYANTEKIQPINIYKNLSLHIYRKGKRGEVWFDFYQRDPYILVEGRSRSSYINRYLPELNAFRNMVWVCAENLNKHQFKKEFMFDKRKIRLFRKRHYYTDVRIIFHDDQSNFTMQLKDLQSFKNITVYPRYPNKDRSLESAQDQYVNQYVRYGKTLERRERKFHRKLHGEAAIFQARKDAVSKQKWLDFQKMYMSDEEKKMSREEWLVYYDKVIANERKALDAGESNTANICRTLELDGFSSGAAFNYNVGGKLRCVYSTFSDLAGNQLVVEEILVIDKSKMEYATYRGSLGVKPVKLYFDDPANNILFIKLRNGSTAVIDSGLEQLLNDKKFEDDVVFEVEILEKQLSSVKQTRHLMGL